MCAVNCPVCSARPAEVGVLCEECRDELSSPIRISQEQILGRVQLSTPSALLDLWGRPHQLDSHSRIGRQLEERGVAVLEPSVSRNHAEMTFDGTAWTLHDLGSANGTFVEDKLIESPTQVNHGDRIRFGHIAFYLAVDMGRLPPPKTSRTTTTTIRPVSLPTGQGNIAPRVDDFAEERTDVGLPELRFRLHEPTGGGGGLIEVDGKQVQLTTTQFELMALMIKRMASESHQPELVRGFVRSSELIADLSWDTREPSENHVKQLVRRVRRALVKSEIGDLIESRHRFGYRLRAIPKP
jgi:pSer/pThr/pTyr-binding forkhead associated (FHA) protein